MTSVVLALKVYIESHLAHVEEHLKALFKGLNVNVESVEATVDGRVRVILSGEDERAALSYLEKEIGLCPSRAEDLRKFLAVKGYIIELDRSREEVYVDIGVSFPKTLHAIIPLQRLQAQLADGRKIALQKIVELYGFSENMPLTVKIVSLSLSEDYVEAELAEAQLAMYRQWIKSLFDRLIVLGVSQQEIRKALKNAKCQNDIITIEPLGLFEHAVVCKLGTDAVGLIPKIGKHLPNTKLEVFKPKTLIEFFENPNIIK